MPFEELTATCPLLPNGNAENEEPLLPLRTKAFRALADADSPKKPEDAPAVVATSSVVSWKIISRG